ncbi:MAG: hypothetical protein D6720_09265 [Gammaproteobacteria bacterium]|nr:MAG: hypothetical protein D6720_09265 [Gammaproteobacteria bacterium]
MSLLLLLQPVHAAPATEAQLQAIARMGELNGVALQCRFVDQVRRIKQELIKRLPKQRALGAWFEQKTNAAFTDFINRGDRCPGLLEFEKDLEQAVARLDEAFSP